MGYDITRFQGEVDEELICPICACVLEEPLQAPLCEHAFCKACINEWLSRQFSCPVDRQSITPNELKPVPRILRNLLSRLLIACTNASLGCTAVVKLERLEIHEKGCEHNPNRLVPCDQGCGLVIPKEEFKDHNCIREIRLMLQNQQHVVCDIQCAINEIRRDIGLLKSCIQEYTRVVRIIPNSPPILLPLEEGEIIRWTNSLQRAKVTQWGGMISNPESVLQAMVRRALNESGCPSHVAAELMENAHERRWPTGLKTLETRQTNRRHYKNYVCKRIPGKQAIVIMAIDNPHMNDDMVLEPGLVMIFAHGVE
ncbi:E3 ubiquitin-protein ligase NRDP1 like protein [Argiope bruennichi]|uniref:E3 ubiquitin-protein ligase NRDP1 n=1 Tax=Argiope bruennichi TaxID=94029 RepID=A0A8T0E8X2_ARGBR|nr:E3 ubiquitin-protein ligase NRDP1 like protein [Argiope bruennichi]